MEFFYVILFNANRSAIDRIKSIIEEKGYVFDFSRNLIRHEIRISSTVLTRRERDILEYAYKKGYFEVNRKVKLEDIANKFHVTKTTANFHLRNAIKKITGDYLLDYGNLDNSDYI
jgi:predicted DNA binding protein